MNTKWFRAAVLSVSAAAVLSGCSASTPLVSQWTNPAYPSPSFRKIMVGCGAGETAVRRNFEDEFAAQLKAAGVDAVPSYRYLAEDQALDEAKLKQAARQAGADAAIFARPVRVEQKTELSPDFYAAPSFGVFGPHIGGWYGLYGQPGIRRYAVYTSEVTFYDLGKNEVIWTATARTDEPENVDGAVKHYVASIVNALKEKKLLPK